MAAWHWSLCWCESVLEHDQTDEASPEIEDDDDDTNDDHDDPPAVAACEH